MQIVRVSTSHPLTPYPLLQGIGGNKEFFKEGLKPLLNTLSPGEITTKGNFTFIIA